MQKISRLIEQKWCFMYLQISLICVMLLSMMGFSINLRDPFVPLFVTNPLNERERNFGNTFVYKPMKYLLNPSLVMCSEPKMLVVDGVVLRENDWLDDELQLIEIGCEQYTVKFVDMDLVLPYGSSRNYRELLEGTNESDGAVNNQMRVIEVKDEITE